MLSLAPKRKLEPVRLVPTESSVRLDAETGLISRDYLNTGQIFLGKQTYMVTVAPGVDAALITAVCVCLDECYNENSGASSGFSGSPC